MNSMPPVEPIIRDFMNLALAHARLALTQFFHHTVEFHVRSIQSYHKAEAIERPSDGHILFFNINGHIKARLWIVMPEGSYQELGQRIVQHYFPDHPGDESYILSGFKEIGNIFVSAFLTGVSTLYPGRYLPSAPAVLEPQEMGEQLHRIEDFYVYVEAAFDLILEGAVYPARMVIAFPSDHYVAFFQPSNPPPVV